MSSYQYKSGLIVKRKRRSLMWLVLALGFIIYAVTVYNWWQEGNRNFEQQKSTISRY